MFRPPNEKSNKQAMPSGTTKITEQPSTAKSTGISYAEVTKRNRKPATKKPKNIRSVARKCWEEKEAPLEFTRFHLELNDSRPLRQCTSKRTKKKLVYAILKSIGIRQHVILATPIGNSRIEVYSIDTLRESMLDILDDRKIKYTVAPNIMKQPEYENAKPINMELVTNRLGWLYYHAKLQNLKKAILDRVPQDLIATITNYLPEYKKTNLITEDAPEVIEIADMDVCESNLQTGAQHHE
jgi:hypothetical protein